MNYKAGPYLFILLLAIFSCNSVLSAEAKPIEILVLGVAQDAGYPQAGCYQAHCLTAWENPANKRLATSLALIDHRHKSYYLFEASPSLPEQLWRVEQYTKQQGYRLSGIFLTHAHIGHYAGLMYLGREAMNTKELPVYLMPRFKSYLESNGPWSQLVKLNNLRLIQLSTDKSIQLGEQIHINSFEVPHRDEYSETVGYRIRTNSGSALFIPDIDKWEKWSTDIGEFVKNVDHAFLDATFYDASEIPNRDMSEVPHPFVVESMQRLQKLSRTDRARINFIHFNHSNPLLQPKHPSTLSVIEAGFKVAQEGDIHVLQ